MWLQEARVNSHAEQSYKEQWTQVILNKDWIILIIKRVSTTDSYITISSSWLNQTKSLATHN